MYECTQDMINKITKALDDFYDRELMDYLQEIGCREDSIGA